MITFNAASLEDIAAEFERLAEVAAEKAPKAATARAEAARLAESRTWVRAAEILRNTKIAGT